MQLLLFFNNFFMSLLLHYIALHQECFLSLLYLPQFLLLFNLVAHHVVEDLVVNLFARPTLSGLDTHVYIATRAQGTF